MLPKVLDSVVNSGNIVMKQLNADCTNSEGVIR